MYFTKKKQMNPISNAYNCDCIDFMRGCEDKSFSLGIADPPYQIGSYRVEVEDEM